VRFSGKNQSRSAENIKEAMEAYIEALIEDGILVPQVV